MQSNLLDKNYPINQESCLERESIENKHLKGIDLKYSQTSTFSLRGKIIKITCITWIFTDMQCEEIWLNVKVRHRMQFSYNTMMVWDFLGIYLNLPVSN